MLATLLFYRLEKQAEVCPEQGLTVGGRTGTRDGLQNHVLPTPVQPGKRKRASPSSDST